MMILYCDECSVGFKMDDDIANTMLADENEGDPIVCGSCQGIYDLYHPDDGPVECSLGTTV